MIDWRASEDSEKGRDPIGSFHFPFRPFSKQGAFSQASLKEITAPKHVRLSPSLQVTLPVYLNQSRTELLFTVNMATRGEPAGQEHRFYERGVAFLASSLSG